MTGFSKSTIGAKQQKKIVRFDAFSTIKNDKKGTLTARDNNNCDCSDGRLKNGVGIRSVAMNFWEADYVILFEPCDGDKEIVGMIRNNEYYQYNDSVFAPVGFEYRQKFSGKMKPFRVFTEDKTAKLLAVGEQGIYEHDKAKRLFVATEMTTPIRQAIFWQNRLFCAVDGCEIIYSAPGKPTDFTKSVEEGGSILFPCERGEIVGLEAMQGDLYIFYEYGIAKLKMAGSPREFIWEYIGYHGGKIVSSSVSSYGDGILFLATDGVYRFNGRSAERIQTGLTLSPKDNGNCVCAVAEGRYYAKYYDNNLATKTIAVECESGKGFFFFIPQKMCFWQGQIFVYHNNSSGVLSRGEIPPTGSSPQFISEATDFSLKGFKRIKRVTLYGDAHCEFVLSSEVGRESFDVRFMGETELVPSLRGKKFTIAIKPIGNCNLRAIEVEVVALKN